MRRTAARVVLLTTAGEVLLLKAHDPADRTKTPWWEIPGGGMDAGETSAQAAERELIEETGITTATIGPCVWTQHNKFTFGGLHFDQDEFIHIAWCDRATDVAPTHLEFLEAQAFEGHHWWQLEALLASDEPVLPPRLREFLPALVAGDLPPDPIDIGTL